MCPADGSQVSCANTRLGFVRPAAYPHGASRILRLLSCGASAVQLRSRAHSELRKRVVHVVVIGLLIWSSSLAGWAWFYVAAGVPFLCYLLKARNRFLRTKGSRSMVTVQRKRREGDLKGEPNTGASKLRAINSDLSQLVRESTTLNPKP